MNPVLIVGGAGFVGSNLANRLLGAGTPVRILDNLSRGHVDRNLEWLRARHGGAVEVCVGDVRDPSTVADAVNGASAVFHFAAQVAVTTSVADPGLDFEVNARGTLNLLEALRARGEPIPLVFTSTNKVYGALSDLRLHAEGTRYVPDDPLVARYGISERRPLDFYSPYGCSKGAADQYVLDYARIFGLRTAVLRMSCIYGPRQFGNEDQGWLAHFALRVLRGETVTLYGDGMQVRDVLYVDDLVDALLLTQTNIARLSGRAFNIGGGPERATSLLELLGLLGRLHRVAPTTDLLGWRPGDQRYYVSDTREFQQAVGWAPKVPLEEGVTRLCAWLAESTLRPRASYTILQGGAL